MAKVTNPMRSPIVMAPSEKINLQNIKRCNFKKHSLKISFGEKSSKNRFEKISETEKRFSSQIESENKENQEPEGELRNRVSSHSHVRAVM